MTRDVESAPRTAERDVARLVPLVAAAMTSQSLFVVLTPSLVAVATDLGVEVAAAGQARSHHRLGLRWGWATACHFTGRTTSAPRSPKTCALVWSARRSGWIGGVAFRLGDVLDRREGARDALVCGAGAFLDLFRRLRAIPPCEHLQPGWQELPVLGDLGPAVDGSQRVAPPNVAVAYLPGERPAWLRRDHR